MSKEVIKYGELKGRDISRPLSQQTTKEDEGKNNGKDRIITPDFQPEKEYEE